MDVKDLNNYSELEILECIQGCVDSVSKGMYNMQDFEYINIHYLQDVALSNGVEGSFSSGKLVGLFKEKYNLEFEDDALLIREFVPLDELYGCVVNLISSEIPKEKYIEVESLLSSLDFVDLECVQVRDYDCLDIITFADGLEGFDLSGLCDDVKTNTLCDILLEDIDEVELEAILAAYGELHLIVGVLGQEVEVLGSIFTKVDSVEYLEDVVDSLGLQRVIRSVDTIGNSEFLEVLDEKLDEEEVRFVRWCLPGDLCGVIQKDNVNLEYMVGVYESASLVFTKQGYGIQVNFIIDGVVKSVLMTLADFFEKELTVGASYNLGYLDNKIYIVEGVICEQKKILRSL